MKTPLFSIAFRRSTVWILWSTLTNAEDPQLSIITFLCVWHGVVVSIRMSVAVSVLANLGRNLLYLTFTCNVKGSNCLLILQTFYESISIKPLSLICCVSHSADYFVMQMKEFTVKGRLSVFRSIVSVSMAL